MNKSHIFTVTESNGIDRAREPVQVGIPLPLGEYRSIDSFALCTEDNELLPSAKTVTARWHDKSIKWCLFNFDVSLQAGQSQPAHQGIEYSPAQMAVIGFIITNGAGRLA